MPDSDDKITETDLTNLVRGVGEPAPEAVKELVLENIRSQSSRTAPLLDKLDDKKRRENDRERDD